MKLSINFNIVLLIITFLSSGICAQDLPLEISSAAPSEWVKGEDFVKRLERNVENNNYVGVIYNYIDNESNFKNEAYEVLGDILVEKVKVFFKTDQVELINLDKVPRIEDLATYIEPSWSNMYNWHATKYKTILYLTFKPDKGIKVESGSDIDKYLYTSQFTFNGSIEIFEFYIKKGKHKSKDLMLTTGPLSLTLKTERVQSYGMPTASIKAKVDIPTPEEVVRIIANNMEIKLSKWANNKLGYAIPPYRIIPKYEKSILSQAENKPIKKETFADKMARISKDGNSIAIIIDVKEIEGEGGGEEVYNVQNSIALPEKNRLKKVGYHLANRLNKSFNKDSLFQFVDIDKLPYDYAWQDTKYKIVVEVTIEPEYWGEFEYLPNKRAYRAKFSFATNLSAYIMEYYIKPENKKPKSLFINAVPVKMGKYEGYSYFLVTKPREITILDLEYNCNRLTGESFQGKMEEYIDRYYVDLIKKLN